MRIVMMGTGTFAEPTFSALIAAREDVVGLVTQPDRDVGRRSTSSRLADYGLMNAALAANIPIAQPQNLNTPEGVAELRAMAPDLVVVAAYGQILKPDVISIPKFGLINVHASLLPKYRGAAPVAYAILKGETVTGVSIIRIAPGLDSGDVLAQETMDIRSDETAGELEARLAPLGARLTLNVIQRMKAGPIVGVKQDPALVTKAPKFTKEMGSIDWSQPSASVRCLIRAMQPWPTAYTQYHRPGKDPMRLIVCMPGRILPYEGSEPPGSVIAVNGVAMGVVCGSGELLEILEIQPAGKKRMAVKDFLRGYPILPGCRMGP